MHVLLLFVFMLGACRPGVEPARAGDAPPPAVARDIEVLNRMLRQRQAASSIQAPPPSTQPARKPQPAPDAGAARVAQLIAGLGDEAKEVRDQARRDLVKIGGPAVPSLLIALDDTELRVRIAAAEALGALKEPRAAEPLAGRLRETSRELWAAVYRAFLGIGPAAVPALLDALERTDSTVRWKAVHLLGEIRDPVAAEALVALLNKDRSTGVRVEIAAALGRIGDRAACDALLDALHDW
jgi:HEAT repeat protein